MGLLDGEAGLHLVREALEGVIEPTAASAALFDALEVQGSERLPANAEELIAFVQGPLHIVVGRRLGTTGADEIVQRIEQTIKRVVKGLPLRHGGAATTLEIMVGTGPVRVLVLSRRSTLAVRLRAALGGMQVQVTSADGESSARDAVEAHDPEIVVIDALSPIGDADSVMEFLAHLPATTTSVLWGEEQSFGRDLKHRAVPRRQKLTTVERSEGVNPLLDLIRSRHR
jgi:hypothetical protein